MSARPKTKAIRNIVLSIAFLLMLLLVAIAVRDRSMTAVVISIGVILGLPVLLLSVADLGRALKIEHHGNYRATLATRLLSHCRAAGGAICISVAGYAFFQNVRELIMGEFTEPLILRLVWVVESVAFVLLGFFFIVRAFARESDEKQESER